jgi:hypothetical protein
MDSNLLKTKSIEALQSDAEGGERSSSARSPPST